MRIRLHLMMRLSQVSACRLCLEYFPYRQHVHASRNTISSHTDGQVVSTRPTTFKATKLNTLLYRSNPKVNENKYVKAQSVTLQTPQQIQQQHLTPLQFDGFHSKP
jgi:hypothetical protein